MVAGVRACMRGVCVCCLSNSFVSDALTFMVLQVKRLTDTDAMPQALNSPQSGLV